MNYEINSLIRWSLKDKNNFNKLTYWVISTLRKKLIQKFTKRYSINNYPKELQKILIQSSKELSTKNNSYKISSSKITDYHAPASIQLASKEINIISEIDWNIQYEDPEDIESIHRWNWLTYLSSDQKITAENLNWGIKEIEKWCFKFQNEIALPQKRLNGLLRWESYTISERISNCIIVSHLNNIQLPEVISKSLIEQTKLLLLRLEYFDNYTGNHIINNARAIYFSGKYFGVTKWCDIAKVIIDLELPKLVTKDGFLREGSSHYQLLFTRWISEILFFSDLFNDKTFASFLRPFVKSLLDKVTFFTVYNKKTKTSQIPLFGDISPDFSPEWIKDLSTCNFYTKTAQMNIPQKSWNRLWMNIKSPIIKNCSSNSIDDKNLIKKFENSGWYRIDKFDFTLILRLDKVGLPLYVGHHHNDAGHFLLYYKGEPVLVDSGRIDYIDQFGLTPAAHNTIAFNKTKGVVPLKPTRYPYDYSKCSNGVEIVNDKKVFKLLLHSDGFSRFDERIKWEREILINPKTVKITDHLNGNGSYNLFTWFHFDRKMKLNIKNHYHNKSIYNMNLNNDSPLFTIINNKSKKINLLNGDDTPLGWQSNKYGEKFPKPTIEISSKVNLPCKNEYFLMWN